MNPRRFFVFTLLLGALALGGCSQLAMNIPDAEQEGVLILRVPVESAALKTLVESYLRERDLFESTFLNSAPADELRINTKWRRDYSLRYYYRIWDRRERHLSSWRSQWKIRPLGLGQSTLEVRVLEVVFVGFPAEIDAGPLPSIDNKQNWYETDMDRLRARLEARRFWQTRLTSAPLPEDLRQFSAPTLNFPVLSKRYLSREQAVERRQRKRAF